MDILSTDKLPKDADQDVPRVLVKGTTTITTSGTSGSWKTGTATLTFSQISSVGNNMIDVVVLDNQTNLTYFSPVQTITGAGDFAITINHYVTGVGGKLTLNVAINKKSGAITDTYTVYYVVYSTSMNSTISL